MIKKVFILIIFLILTRKTYNQIYPVSTYTQTIPPYPASLDGYVSQPINKINLRITVNDATLINYPVKLRMTLKSNKVIITTSSNNRIEPIYINGGETIILTSEELREYFNLENLDFYGYSKAQYVRNGQLPDGVYQLYFEVLDYYRNFVISSNTPSYLYIYVNDPPILNTPGNKSVVEITGQQNIMFSWAFRHSVF